MKRNNIYITLVTLLVLVTFSACKVGKSYTRPDLHLPDSLAQHQDSLSFGDMDWWNIYTDSSRSWQPNISITLADNTVYPYKGYVDFAEPQVDPQTGTFSVRAEMPNPKHVLLPGQFTKVKLLLDVRENATVVPLKSVIIEKGGAYVFVMRRDSTVERRFIELGPEFQNQVVVERGLVPGETIVVEGYHKLSPGVKVKVNNALLKKEEGEEVDERRREQGDKEPSV